MTCIVTFHRRGYPGAQKVHVNGHYVCDVYRSCDEPGYWRYGETFFSSLQAAKAHIREDLQYDYQDYAGIEATYTT